MQPNTAYVYHGGGSGRRGFWSNIDPLKKDIKVKISEQDTTTDFLENKIVAGSNIQLTKLNVGDDEQIEIKNIMVVPPDIFVKISDDDTTANFLNQKIVAGNNITLNEIDIAGNKKIQINSNALDIKVKNSVNDTTTNYLSQKIVAGSNVTLTTLNPNGNEQLQINVNFGSQKERFTLDFCQTDTIAVGSLCPAPNAASYPSLSNGAYICATQGYYMPFKVKIVRMQAMTPRYISVNNGHLRFQIKTTPANVLRTTDTTMALGVNLINLDLLTPNTAASYGYNFGQNYELLSENLTCDAGHMIFIAHCNISAGCTYYGSNCKVFVEEF